MTEKDKELLFNRSSIPKHPDCSKCGIDACCCCGCPPARAYEEAVRVYKERGLEEALTKLQRLDWLNDKLEQLHKELEALESERQDLEEFENSLR